jgi:aryl-alcohol dehydrogenase-like predicted oxidoreductase
VDTRKVGELDVTVVGIGCNNFGRRLDRAGTDAVVKAAMEVGINFFDTADVYGDGASEEYLGKALGPRRDEVVIATKFGVQLGDDPSRGGASPRWIERAVEDSLRRLNTDRIDLYQLHKPDENTPIEDTLEALDKLVSAGKVGQIGCSNHSEAQIEDALSTSRERGLAPFVSVQNEYSLLHREPEENGVIETCQRNGLALLPYFPLASGMLTGKYTRDGGAPAGSRLAGLSASMTERFANTRNFDLVERFEAFAEERGHTILELAISWLVARPVVASVISGATSPEQVRANAEAAKWELCPEDLEEIDRITRAPHAS